MLTFNVDATKLVYGANSLDIFYQCINASNPSLGLTKTNSTILLVQPFGWSQSPKTTITRIQQNSAPYKVYEFLYDRLDINNALGTPVLSATDILAVKLMLNSATILDFLAKKYNRPWTPDDVWVDTSYIEFTGGKVTPNWLMKTRYNSLFWWNERIVQIHPPGTLVKVLQVTAQNTSKDNGKSNTAYYETFSNTAVAIATGDVLVYAVQLYGPSAQSAIDARVNIPAAVNLRDYALNAPQLKDTRGVGIHPAESLAGLADGKWYYRTIALTYFAGKTLDQWRVGFEGDNSGSYTSNFRDIYVKNSAGQIKAILFDGTLQVPAVVGADNGNLGTYSRITKQVVDMYI